MNAESLSLLAGAISSFIFASSHIPMLVKAYRTRDLHSYSSLYLIMNNVGNVLYWFYVVSLPPGPVWVLHTFYTVSSILLLILYFSLQPLFLAGLFRRSGRLVFSIRNYILNVPAVYILIYRHSLKHLLELTMPHLRAPAHVTVCNQLVQANFEKF